MTFRGRPFWDNSVGFYFDGVSLVKLLLSLLYYAFLSASPNGDSRSGTSIMGSMLRASLEIVY